MAINSFKDLDVWQGGMELAAECYRTARLMPKAEEYRLTSQLLRAATSIPANIAEGHSRATRRDYAHFISIARGSLAETETLLLLAVRTQLLAEPETVPALSLTERLGRQLNVLHQRLAGA